MVASAERFKTAHTYWNLINVLGFFTVYRGVAAISRASRFWQAVLHVC